MASWNAQQLFAAVIASGAALACGQTEGSSSGAGSGGTGSGGTAGARDGGDDAAPADGSATPPQPLDCPRQFRCDNYSPPTNCRCDSNALDEPTDCPNPAQFRCQCIDLNTGQSNDCRSGWDGTNTIVPVCECDDERPLKPEDCQHTAQFQCEQYQPEYISCRCDENAPKSADECEDPRFWVCAEDMPPVGCSCIVPIL